ncbi:MAG: hypothetical protein JW795_18065 [Chitinivibrionales bacterium]|nr:hypothetical protein [Chitinivibrionales bacterium]
MIHTRILTLLFFPILLIANLCSGQKYHSIVQEYNSKTTEDRAATIRTNLASNVPSDRDNAVLFLSFLMHAGKNSPKEHETILRLAENKEVVSIASDIVTERLAGWYEERVLAYERIMPMYYPLIYLLSISKSKIAGMTLLAALPIVGFDEFFRKSVVANELVLKNVPSKLATIENKLCCFYPGKDLVCDMQAIDLRLTMLGICLEAAKNNSADSFINGVEMKKFISDCLEFGDGNKGRVIRTWALEIACILIQAGQKEFLPAVKRIAETDPCYLYRAGLSESNSLPQYDINSKYYPVREKALKELSLQR